MYIIFCLVLVALSTATAATPKTTSKVTTQAKTATAATPKTTSKVATQAKIATAAPKTTTDDTAASAVEHKAKLAATAQAPAEAKAKVDAEAKTKAAADPAQAPAEAKAKAAADPAQAPAEAKAKVDAEAKAKADGIAQAAATAKAAADPAQAKKDQAAGGTAPVLTITSHVTTDFISRLPKGAQLPANTPPLTFKLTLNGKPTTVLAKQDLKAVLTALIALAPNAPTNATAGLLTALNYGLLLLNPTGTPGVATSVEAAVAAFQIAQYIGIKK